KRAARLGGGWRLRSEWLLGVPCRSRMAARRRLLAAFNRLEKGPILVPPALEFEFRMRVQIGAPLDQGTWDGQRRRVIPIVGGTFEGPRFSGTVLPGGADWQSVRVTDGVARIDARYTLRHDDGTLVTMVDRGVRRG